MDEVGDEENLFTLESDEVLKLLRNLDSGLVQTSGMLLTATEDAKENCRDQSESA